MVWPLYVSVSATLPQGLKLPLYMQFLLCLSLFLLLFLFFSSLKCFFVVVGDYVSAVALVVAVIDQVLVLFLFLLSVLVFVDVRCHCCLVERHLSHARTRCNERCKLSSASGVSLRIGACETGAGFA